MQRPRSLFPPAHFASAEGVVFLSKNLEIEQLISAYANGIFPWPQSEEEPLLWFCPWQRAVLDFSDLHLSRSFRRDFKKCSFEFSVNQAFPDVIRACAQQVRPRQDGTWITKKLQKAYIDLHIAGYAHSLEAWCGEELVGGIYGVSIGPTFSAESMFYKEGNASKFCLYQLVELLKAKSLLWLDVQMLTEVTASFGAKYIGQEDFLVRLERDWQKASAMSWNGDSSLL